MMIMAANTPITAPAIVPTLELEDERVVVDWVPGVEVGEKKGAVEDEELPAAVTFSGGANEGISSSVWNTNLSSCSSALPFASEPKLWITIVWYVSRRGGDW
jgi:hypothetical protein